MAGAEPPSWTQSRAQTLGVQFPDVTQTTPTDVITQDATKAAAGQMPSAFSQTALALANYDPYADNGDWTQQVPHDLAGARGYAANLTPPVNAPPSSSIGETLGNFAGLFNPLSENSVFGTFAPDANPIAQELLRPANYIPVGGGVAGVLRGAAGAVGGRLATDVANQLLPEDTNPLLRIGIDLGAAALGGGGTIAAANRIRSTSWANTAREAYLKALSDEGIIKAFNQPVPLAPGEATPAMHIPNPFPAPVRAQPGAPEVGTRTGSLLRPRGLDQLGQDATVSDVIGVSNDLRRQVSSQTVSLMAEARQANQVLGPTVKDGRGNVRLVAVIKPDGAPALKQDVIENPGRYNLTAEQVQAVDTLRQVAWLARNEAQTFGLDLRETGLEDGQGYFPRLATQDTNAADLTGQRGGGGQRLRNFREQSRVFTDPLEAVNNGVVYADPIEALGRYVDANLQGAANSHLTGMFKTFGESAAQRVSPQLRAQHDALVQKLSSLKSTFGRLDQRLNATVDSYLNNPNPDLDALYTDLQDVKVGANAVGVQGVNYGKTPAQMRSEINAAQQDILKLRPLWRQAVEASRQVPPGRARVSAETAPALQGLDFTEADAKRINNYYQNGILPQSALGKAIGGIKAFNRNIVPVQAIGDASATLRQLGTVLPSKPATFLKNFGLSMRDSFWPGGHDQYERWLASPEVRDAAAHGVVVNGEGGRQGFDFWSNVISKVPGLKQTEQQFEAIGNRNRVDLYHQDLDMLRRTGKPVDEQAMEQVGRNTNRITGASNVRATDAETLAEFAPNWMRARLETLGKVVADGGIEGSLARGYMKNYISTGLLLTAGIAAAQGRNVRDVLTPIQSDGRGGFRRNPNFGTIRVFGVDIDVFSGYSDLAAMAEIAADGAIGAIRERDATRLVKGLYQSAETKGGPAFSTIRDLTAAVLGNKVFGQDPRSWAFWLEKPSPITGAQTAQAIQSGQSPGQIAVGGAANFLGARANAMTATEQTQVGGWDAFAKLSAPQQLNALSGLSWSRVKAAAQGGEWEADLAKYPTYGAWYQATLDRYTQTYQQQYHLPLGVAQVQAQQAMAQNDIVQAYQADHRALSQWFAQQHPKEADAELQKGKDSRLSSAKDVRNAIGTAP